VKKNSADLFLSYDTFAGEVMSGTTSGIAVMEATYAAFNAKDFNRIDRLLVPGATVTNMPDGNAVPAREDFENWAAAFPDAHLEIVRAIESGDMVCVESIGRGTHTGPFRTPMGTFPPTGRRGELPLVDVVTMRDGKIAGIRTYFDTNSLMMQLGLTPSMGVPPPAKVAPRPEARH
jgi:ketosteroid isomerase-like protein